jgi:cysteine dioxygenase
MRITRLDELFKHLEYGEGYGGYARLFSQLAIPLTALEPLLECDKQHYRRKLLQRTGSYELLLMCWQQQQASPIHSYAGQQGWIYLASGQLALDYYLRTDSNNHMELYKSIALNAGEYAYLNDYIGFHRVRHLGEERAVSLHLHAAPVDEWEVFLPETNEYLFMSPGPHTDK